MNFKNKKLFSFFFALVVVLAIAVRFIALDKVPAGLYYDEVDLGYQVKSFLSTGKDYRGTVSPFFFRSMNTDKTPFPIYFSAITSLLFQSPEYQVRAGVAAAGVISVLLAMLLVYQLSSNKVASIATGFVFAFSPWQIQFSRISFEAMFMQMVLLVTVLSFLHWLKTKNTWFYFLTAFLLGLNVYTYRPMSLFAPITFLVLLAIFYKDFIKQGVVRVLLWLSIIGVMALPFLYVTTIASADQPRINQISIFSDKRVPIFVQRNRELDSSDFANPEIGKKAVRSSFVFHNKVLSYLTNFGRNYIQNFSGEFLFLCGDPNPRHSPKDTGVLLFVDIIGLVAGLVVVGKNIKDKKYQLLLALLLLSPIPSDLTMDGGNHASRLMLMSGPLLIIIGMGYAEIIRLLCQNKKLLLGIPILVLLWIVSVIFYLHQYFIHFPIDSSRSFGYGYDQAIKKINQVGDQYQAIRLTENSEPSMLYYLFWANVPPNEIQAYGFEFGEDVVKNQSLDKVKPVYFGDRLCLAKEITKLNSDTLYLVTYGNLPIDLREADKDPIPMGIKLIGVIKYPDNEVAFYLITRDSQNGIGIQPDKPSYCNN